MARIISLIVHLLSALFGLSAWIAINGLWQQTPLLVSRLPEAWNLASYITLITQLANVGPLIYALLRRLYASPVSYYYYYPELIFLILETI